VAACTARTTASMASPLGEKYTATRAEEKGSAAQSMPTPHRKMAARKATHCELQRNFPTIAMTLFSGWGRGGAPGMRWGEGFGKGGFGAGLEDWERHGTCPSS